MLPTPGDSQHGLRGRWRRALQPSSPAPQHPRPISRSPTAGPFPAMRSAGRNGGRPALPALFQVNLSAPTMCGSLHVNPMLGDPEMSQMGAPLLRLLQTVSKAEGRSTVLRYMGTQREYPPQMGGQGGLPGGGAI